MTEKKARKIVREFREQGGAFVEDDYITVDGEDVYNPVVDHISAESWLLDRLMRK